MLFSRLCDSACLSPLSSYLTQMASPATSVTSGAKPNQKQLQQVVFGLNQLRSEQRQLSQKILELDGDLNEHRLVTEALKEVDPQRKCFRMIGGVLIEQQVKDVLPGLASQMDMLKLTMETYNKKMSERSEQINEYIKTHNLAQLIRKQNTEPEAEKDKKDQSRAGSSVLV